MNEVRLPDDTRLPNESATRGVQLAALFWSLLVGFTLFVSVPGVDPAALAYALNNAFESVVQALAFRPRLTIAGLVCFALTAWVAIWFSTREKYPLLGFAVGGVAAAVIGSGLWHVVALVLHLSPSRGDYTWRFVTVGALAGILAWGIVHAGAQRLSVDTVRPIHRAIALVLAVVTAIVLHGPSYEYRPNSNPQIHLPTILDVLEILLFGVFPGYFAVLLVLTWFRGTLLAALGAGVICLLTALGHWGALGTAIFCGVPAGAAAWCYMWLVRRRDGDAPHAFVIGRGIQYLAACIGAALPFAYVAKRYLLDPNPPFSFFYY